MFKNTTYRIPSNIIKKDGKFKFVRFLKEDRLLEWFDVALKTGESHLRSQRAWHLAERCLSILLNEEDIKLPEGNDELSRLYINRIAKVTMEAIANQANIRPRWRFVASNKSNEKQVKDAELFDKKLEYWWTDQQGDLALTSVLQHAAPTGTGYIGLLPKRDLFGDGKYKIKPNVYDYKSVMVGHLPKNQNIDDAYFTIIVEEMPLSQFHEEFPQYQSYENIESGTPSWMWNGFKKSAKQVYSVFNMKQWREDRAKQIDNPFPNVKAFYIYIRDTTINTTGSPILMGDINDDFSYIVPSYYDEYGEINQIETGQYETVYTDTNTNGENKDKIPVYRNVEKRDCMLYPNRRLLICTRDKVLYDGANKYWTNGLVPIAPFHFIKWVTEFLGLPFISSAISAQTELNRLLRGLMDAVIGKINPPLGVDESVPDKFLKNFNPRAAIGKVIKYPLRLLKDAFSPILPADFYNIDARAFELVKFLIDSIDYILSSNDLSAALKLRQTPSADTQEKLLESMGAIPTAINRGIERSLERLGNIWLGLECQYSTTQETIRILGADSLSYETYDYDPNSIIPLTDENDRRPRWKRAKDYLTNLTFTIAPNSLHERQSITHKLELLQMKNVGLEIPNRLIVESFRPNDSYEALRTEYFEEQRAKLLFATEMQNEAQGKSNNNQGMGSSLLEAALNLLHNNQNKVGHPSSYQNAPQLEQKKNEDGTPRTTLTTS